MKIIKAVGQEFLNWKWSLWILFLFPYGWMLKLELIKISDQLDVAMNVWDLIIGFMHNPALMIYLLLPVLLLFFSKTLLQHGEYTTLIRIGSYTRWIFYTIRKILPILLLLLMLWLIVSFLVALSMPIYLSWSVYAMNDYGMNNIIYSLQQYFIYPPFAILIQILQYLLFFIVVHTIIATTYLFRPKTSTLIFLSVWFYVGTILSYKIPTEWTWLHISHYIFTDSSLNNFQSVVPTFSVLTSTFVGCLVIVKLLKK